MASKHAANHCQEATEVFRKLKDFEEYQKLVGADSLDHGLLFGVLGDALKDFREPLRILDLGCGDAGNMSKVLSTRSKLVASYTGVDMTESAISTAYANLRESLGDALPICLHVSDMLSYLQAVRGTFDVVVAAFAIHHLTSADKLQVLKEIRRLLAPERGVFLMVDPFRRKGETLDAYRKRASEVGETWLSMAEEQRRAFIKHMQDYDIMEEEDFFEKASRDNGFAHMEVLCRGQKGLQSCVSALRA